MKNLKAGFVQPADQYKPGVYWYFMDGNMSAETITKDLESMKKAGIGNLIFLEVNVGVPRGTVEFLSNTWTSLFVHAEKEARRLGIEITLGIGPGWTGSGGPWVKPEESMQHLVCSRVIVSADTHDKIVLPVPLPKKPFFGEGSLSAEVKKEWTNYYKDVAVLAFPFTDQKTLIEDDEEKALYYRAPYSSGTVKPYLSSPSNAPGQKNEAIQKSRVLDLTGKMQPDGTLNWSPPSGKWTIMRFGSRNNGAITRPAPVPGLGFEADKFDTTALNHHLNTYVGKLLDKIGKIQKNEQGGLKRLHMDSWEMGAQNWTGNFRKEFLKRRGYDPLKYYPVYSGYTVGSLGESERFLWDLRQTAQELVLENHAQHVKRYAKGHQLSLSIEPYDMNPTADLELGAVADVPMAEFWSKGFGFNSTYSVIEATSIAHVMGKSLVPAEAFTAQDDEGWKQHPGSMKNQGDWAFAAGINRFVYHTFQNQFLPDSLKPGATMGPYGVHWDRSQTWWPMVEAYHTYVSRCQYLLQQGRTVADVLYLTPEGSPLVFVPPASAIAGDVIGDRKGYNFDGCSPGQLMKASVRNHQVVFPGGAAYRLLVLPAYESMTPELLAKIAELIKQGATVVGSPPSRSPSLVDYPNCDRKVASLSKSIWGSANKPAKETYRSHGKGQIIWGGSLSFKFDRLYPFYEETARILKSKKLDEDFHADGPVRYTHRTDDNKDLYFISNTSDKPIKIRAWFRSIKGAPELWNAVSGKISALHEFQTDQSRTLVPLQLDAYESCFILFSKENQWLPSAKSNEITLSSLMTLNGFWDVRFDPKWGGPAHTVFDTLSDWTKNSNEGVKYYSGIASYHKVFDLKSVNQVKGSAALHLDLGQVKNMARVILNGKDLGVLWTAPWRMDISSAVKEKNNELIIEVANLWPNRLIGDEKKPYDGVVNGQWPEWLLKNQPRTSGRYTFTSSQPYKADSPLFESGLIGPVSIVQEVIKEIK
ncbi:glycosyl hydrolase [Pedobacter sp. HMWF019]|uniref:glycosyl hydrolase n=1 Tax=Pedobacter sp. HMWF019 TaxID=2056856 RepID=UPI001E3D347D|nr:glycosyl hydrolase [Pedobacter sp. HMWF019]